ncbi:MAG: N-acetylmuramoyl-L-alanine amidase-like domain-containing protein, partial [Dissulfurispiraceae bacterium]
FSEEGLNQLINKASEIGDPGMRIAFISGAFLDIGYKAQTLIGDQERPETFVIDLEGVDCVTYIEYVEALRLSGSYQQFKDKLKRVRYRLGQVSFERRNHFFTDWREFNSEYVRDVTEQTGRGRIKKVRKILNGKDDGTLYVPGIPLTERDITYIPSDVIDAEVIWNLETGDYAGLYSEAQGLDVSHVGIVIKKEGNVYLRHASSDTNHKKVLDQDFPGYVRQKDGLVVLRPMN